MFRRIAVGVDGSDGARAAVEAAIKLAHAVKAEIFLVSVVELPRYPATVDEIADEQHTAKRFFQEAQRQAVERVNAAGLLAHRDIRGGHAAQALSHYAMEVGADLLVIGHSGRSGIWGRLLGTTADKVVEHAPCSVLVVR
jgi:nucleotide-binding universal stress UspA family protein